MKHPKYICRNCGSTKINYPKKVNGVFNLQKEANTKTGCFDCGSKDITHFPIPCDECGNFNLYFDDTRFEIVCTTCGLVNAGTDPKTNYPLGFLLRVPSWYYHENTGRQSELDYISF